MDLQSIGLPHSEIPGSGVICTSPGLIAAYHVLPRLREPRHPPVALSYFFLSVRTLFLGLLLAVPASEPVVLTKSYFSILRLSFGF